MNLKKNYKKLNFFTNRRDLAHQLIDLNKFTGVVSAQYMHNFSIM